MALDELWRQVYAAPEDDDVRAVLADALLSVGDPRGELIALQLQPEDPTRAARIAQLVEVHGSTWLGPLRALANRAQFRRGFVARLEPAGHVLSRELVEHPMLATIEELVAGHIHPRIYRRLVTSPAMRGLRQIDVFESESVAALADAPGPIDHVAIRARPPVPVGEMLDVAAARGIRSIAIDAVAIDRVLAHPIASRLDAITLAGPLHHSVAIARTLRPSLDVRFVGVAALEPCIAGPRITLGGGRLVRDDERHVLRGWGQWFAEELLASANQLAGIARIELTSRQAARWLASELAIEIVVIAEPARVGFVRVPTSS